MLYCKLEIWILRKQKTFEWHMRTFITVVCVSHFFVLYLLKIPKHVNVLQYHRSLKSYIFYLILVPTVKPVNGNQKNILTFTENAIEILIVTAKTSFVISCHSKHGNLDTKRTKKFQWHMTTFMTFLCLSHFFVLYLLKIPKHVNVSQYHRSL